MVVAVSALALLSIGLLSGATTARARAGTAADAAALAAAVVAQQGGDGCAAAARMAAAHRAVLSRCTVASTGAVVTVAVPLRMGVAGVARTWSVTGRARAGPAGPR